MVYPDKKFENESYLSKTKYKKFKKTRPNRGRDVFFNNRGGRSDYHGNRHYWNRNASFYNGRLLPQRKFQHKKPPSRPPSPIVGSEEYTKRKIAETSSKIMMHLLNPEIPLKEKQPELSEDKITDINDEEVQNKLHETNNTSKTKSKSTAASEIHAKILNHITSLNKGRKKIFINAKTSTYDIFIQQIQKKKRLELSRIFRRMCAKEISETNNEADDLLNSIIPDIGIKIDELPKELIEELRSTLDITFDDFEDANPTENLENLEDIHNESIDIDDFPGIIKMEPLDNNYEDFSKNNSTESTNLNEEQLLNEINSVNTESTPQKEQENNPNSDKNNDTNLEENKDYETMIIKEEKSEEVSSSSAQTTSTEFTLKPIKEEKIEDEIKEEKSEDISSNSAQTTSTEITLKPFEEKKIEDEIKEENEFTFEDFYDISTTYPDTQTEKTSLSCSDINNQDKNENSTTDKTSISTQTSVPTKNRYCQTVGTDLFSEIKRKLLKNFEGKTPDTMSGCLKVMEDVDYLVNKLTNFRQNLFKQFKVDSCDKRTQKKRKRDENKGKNSKRSKVNERSNKSHDNFQERKDASEEKSPEKIIENKSKETEEKTLNFDYKLLVFPEVKEKVLVTKLIEDSLVITTERGKVHFCSLEDGTFKNTLEVSNMPVTCLDYNKQDSKLYVGTFESELKIYDFKSLKMLKNEPIDDGIQCIEYKWDYIFMGGRRGYLMRYSEKNKKIEYTDKISDSNVMVLKPTLEGARRILLVGSRHAPVTIRDAMTGLHMRTLANHISPTVYSLLLEKSLVYCGTTAHNVLVFSFNDGSLRDTYNAPNSKGIGSMKIFENILFACCHNGFIYAYNLKDNKLIGDIKGPGGVILSMEVIKYQIIVSTMWLKFTSIPIPTYILKHVVPT